jgi:hypothetical protein
LTTFARSASISGNERKMNNLSFGEKAYSAAKVTAVLDALASEGIPPFDVLGGADVSFDNLHSP